MVRAGAALGSVANALIAGTHTCSLQRIAQKQLVAPTSCVAQASPQRFAWCEVRSHDHDWTSIALFAAGNLRRERQEQLVDQSLVIEVGQQTRSAFNEDASAALREQHSPEYRVGPDLARAAMNRADLRSRGQ